MLSNSKHIRVQKLKLSLTYSDSLYDGSLCSVRVGDVTVAAVVKVTGGVLLTAEL